MHKKGPEATPALRRRTFLQRTGAVIALPWLESLLPRAARAATSAVAPTRLISYFVPLGMLEGSQENGYANQNNWVPTTTGANYALSPALTPLAAFKARFTVVSNTDATVQNQPMPAKAGHAKGVQLYCSAVPLGQAGTLGSGMSFDQVVAAAVGGATRLPSLQLAINDEKPYSDDPADPAYLQTISWSSATSPLPALNSPTVAFNTLFPNARSRAKTPAGRSFRQHSAPLRRRCSGASSMRPWPRPRRCRRASAPANDRSSTNFSPTYARWKRRWCQTPRAAAVAQRPTTRAPRPATSRARPPPPPRTILSPASPSTRS